MAIVVEHDKRKHEILEKALEVFIEEDSVEELIEEEAATVSPTSSTSIERVCERYCLAIFSITKIKVGGLTINGSCGINCSGTLDLASSPKICSRSK